MCTVYKCLNVMFVHNYHVCKYVTNLSISKYKIYHWLDYKNQM